MEPASSSGWSSAGVSATPSSTRPFAARTPRSASSRRSPGTPTRKAARRRSRARPAPGSPIRTTTSRSSGSRPAQRLAAGADGLGRSEDEDAGARDLRLAAQRRHLPGRDLEDLSPRRPGERGAGRGKGRGRLPRSQRARFRLRPAHPSLQGLRLDRDAALPLALQLLPEPLAQPGERLDGRDLRTLGRRARSGDRHADALVLDPEHAQADDRPAGLRRRRQSGPDLDPRQGPGESQGDRARRLGLSEASRGSRLRSGGARRRRRHRGLAAGALGLARLDGPDRRRRPGPARPLHRLLRALRDQPRRARPRPGVPGGVAQRRPGGGPDHPRAAPRRASGRNRPLPRPRPK